MGHDSACRPGIMASDRAFGAGLLAFSVALFLYYTVWVLLTPFAPDDHVINSFFPPRYYAVLLPALAGVTVVAVVLIFVGFVMLTTKKPRAKAA